MLDTIIKDLTTAMKEQDKFKLSVLRMLKSALQMEKISKKHDLSDEEVITVIKRQVKTRKDSMEEYKKYNKEEEVQNLTKEIEILNEYLPAEMSDDDINKALDAIFDELKPESIKDMGKVMKEASAIFKGKADMGVVNSKIKEKLNSL